MNTNTFLKFVLISLFLHILANPFSSSSVKADTIVIAADSWCPINCEPGSEKPGFMVEIAQAIFSKYGHRIIYKKIPWARTLLLVRNGDIDGAIGPYRNDAPDFIFPDEEQAMISFNMFVTQENDWTYDGMHSLDNILLGVIKDYSYLNTIDNYIETNKNNRRKIFFAFGEDPLKKNIQLLLFGRIDAIIETDLVFKHVATQMGVENKVKLAGIATEPDKAYIAFSPNLPESKEYAKILSEGMKELRKTGKLKDILLKYGLSDWKK